MRRPRGPRGHWLFGNKCGHKPLEPRNGLKLSEAAPKKRA